MTVLFFTLLCVSFLRYRTNKINKKRFQAFLIRRENQLHLVEQGVYNDRVDSIYTLGEIVRVFKYKDAQKVVKTYPELLSADKQYVLVNVEDERLEGYLKERDASYKKETEVVDRRYKPFSTTNVCINEEKELEVIKL